MMGWSDGMVNFCVGFAALVACVGTAAMVAAWHFDTFERERLKIGEVVFCALMATVGSIPVSAMVTINVFSDEIAKIREANRAFIGTVPENSYAGEFPAEASTVYGAVALSDSEAELMALSLEMGLKDEERRYRERMDALARTSARLEAEAVARTSARLEAEAVTGMTAKLETDAVAANPKGWLAARIGNAGRISAGGVSLVIGKEVARLEGLAAGTDDIDAIMAYGTAIDALRRMEAEIAADAAGREGR